MNFPRSQHNIIVVGKISMFSEDDLLKLHQCKDYQKTNGWLQNLCFIAVIQMSDADTVTLETLYNVANSFWVFCVIKLWGLLKFPYIIHELVHSRSCIIEGILCDQYTIPEDMLIRSSLKKRSYWLELNEKKLDILQASCFSYLDSIENRKILYEVSHISNQEEKAAKLIEARNKINAIFAIERLKILSRQRDSINYKYTDALESPDISQQLVDHIQQRRQSGNLTVNAMQDRKEEDSHGN